MRKIMLVIDDYQELVVFENLLRRLGFDVLSLGKELLVSDALFRFHPDIVIATAKGHGVDGMKVAARVKKQFPPPKVALAYTGSAAPTLTADMRMIVDGLIALPVQPVNLIKLVSRLGSLEVDPLLEKFRKITTPPVSEPDEVRVQGQAPPEAESIRVFGSRETNGVWDPAKTPGLAAKIRSERSNRYDAFLRDHEEEPPERTPPSEETQAALEELEAEVEREKGQIDEINREKFKFAKTLFVDAPETAGKKKAKK